MILDFIIIAVVAIAAVIGYRRGLAKTVFAFAGTLLAMVAAYLTARYLANFIYKSFIISAVSESVQSSFSQTVTSADSVASDALESLPAFFSGILGFFGVNGVSLGSAIDVKSTAEGVTGAMNSVLAPVLISVMTVAFIILLFIIFKLLIRLLSKVILKIFELPVIRVVNRILGGVFGLCEGLLLIYAAILIIRIIFPYIDAPLITEELINSSFLFKTIYNLGFTTVISDVINHGII